MDDPNALAILGIEFTYQPRRARDNASRR